MEKETIVNQNRFDGLTRSLTSVPSRRDVLRGLAAAVVGVGAARVPGVVAARKTRKPKSPKPNEFGCLDVGDRCKTAGQCCSGICKGKRGKRRCRAHDSGGCKAGKYPTVCGGMDVACTTSRGKPGLCVTTTGNAGYCMATSLPYACRTDSDCRSTPGGILGPRAACYRCSQSMVGTFCATPDVVESMESPTG
jgi:hypothetical protein